MGGMDGWDGWTEKKRTSSHVTCVHTRQHSITFVLMLFVFARYLIVHLFFLYFAQKFQAKIQNKAPFVIGSTGAHRTSVHFFRAYLQNTDGPLPPFSVSPFYNGSCLQVPVRIFRESLSTAAIGYEVIPTSSPVLLVQMIPVCMLVLCLYKVRKDLSLTLCPTCVTKPPPISTPAVSTEAAYLQVNSPLLASIFSVEFVALDRGRICSEWCRNASRAQ